MMRTFVPGLLLAAALATTAGVTTADAGGGRHFKGHGFHGKFHHYGFRRSYGYGYGHGYGRGYGGSDCGFFYGKWKDTGSFYWKRKYYSCKGWHY